MKARAMKGLAGLLAALLILAIGFEMGARSAKFSPASEVEFSGLLVNSPANKSWSM